MKTNFNRKKRVSIESKTSATINHLSRRGDDKNRKLHEKLLYTIAH